ncbi:MAG: hypothetical protein B6244_03055 [Candidatus Cloacimonetes bacterium 4572_55]|nr:MAG: hypothetical protein B6244_03055 [Candidatus Cloacimonetes bacterium 4572_55]
MVIKNRLFLISILIFIWSSICSAQIIDERYHRLDEIESELQNYTETYSDLAQIKVLGQTGVDSLPLYAMKISDNVTEEEDEPAIFYLGSLHAEEILGIEVAMFMIDSLLTGYAEGNPQVRQWVDNCEIWIMPTANPEGHQVVMEELDVLYRKNKRDNNNNGTFLEGIDYSPGMEMSSSGEDWGEGFSDADGVDLNRNWDYEWQNGNSNPAYNYYRGPEPFSEPEVRAMRDHIRDEKVVFALFMHSSRLGDPDSPYQGTYYNGKESKRERLFYPWTRENGWTNISPDFWTIREMAATIADAIPREEPDPNNCPTCYRCDLSISTPRGDARHYTYTEFGVYSLNIELGRWIQPPGDFVDPFCRKIMDSVTHLLDRAAYSGVTGHITDAATGLPLDAEIEILQLDTSSETEPRMSDPHTGRYYRFLRPNGLINMTSHLCHRDFPSNPSQYGSAPENYTLRVSKSGYAAETVPNQRVTNDGLTIMDVQLEYQNFMNNFPAETGSVRYSAPTLRDVNHDLVVEIAVASAEGAVHLLDSQGQEVPGWPNLTGGHPTLDESSSPAIGDVDQDGEFEIVYGSVDGNLYVWRPDGSLLDGFPVNLDQPVIRSSAVLYDVDNDTRLEIFIAAGTHIHAYRYDGSVLPGWPQTTAESIQTSVAIADIDHDGEIELVATAGSVYLWEIDGSPMPLSPFDFSYPITSSPVLADIDDDDDLEIFFGGSNSSIWGVHHDLTLIESFSQTVGDGSPESETWEAASPAIGDIDGDGDLEVIFGLNTWSQDQGALCAYHHNGDPVNGFPVQTESAVTAQPIIANVNDNSSHQNILFGTMNGYFHIVDYQGNSIQGFPYPLSASGITGSAAVGDLDGDNMIEFAIGSSDGNLFAFETGQLYMPSRMDWPMFQNNHYNTGYYDLYNQVEIEDQTEEIYDFFLHTPYPNPTRGQATINYSLPAPSPVKLIVYDVSGRRVRSIIDGTMKAAGTHRTIWDGCNDNRKLVGSGIYFFQLGAGSFGSETRRVALIR